MGKQLFIGLAVEGSTDMRFLKSVVLRTFLRIVYEQCEQDVDVDLFELKPQKIGKSFPEFVLEASKEGVGKYGIMILAVHADSDKESLQERIRDKFAPAQHALDQEDENLYCKTLTPVIPMRMIEAWMLADTALLKEEMGTTLSDASLGLHRLPESIADPKSLIERAVSIAMQQRPKKRRTLSIADLYEILGDEIAIEALLRLPSYQSFYQAAIDSLRRIHYLQ